MLRSGLSLIASVVVLAPATAMAAAPRGALSPLPGKQACLAESSRSRCAKVRALETPEAVAISPDGRTVYAGADFTMSVAVFRRDRATGALTQPDGTDGCVAADRQAVAADPHHPPAR